MNKIIIGTWPLSGEFGFIRKKEAEEILVYSFEKGFNSYDVAPNYGDGSAETLLGELFHNKNVKISTKVGNFGTYKSFTFNDMVRSLEVSFKRLRSSRVEKIYIHNPRNGEYSIDEISRFRDFVLENKLCSGLYLSAAKNELYSNDFLKLFSGVMDDLNLLSFNISRFKDIKLEARSVLASGLLSKKFDSNTTFDQRDHRYKWVNGERKNSILKRIKILKLSFPNIEIESLARRFIIYSSKISSVIIGIKSKAHVDELLNDLNNMPLSASENEIIFSLQKNDFGLLNEESLNF